MSDEGEVKASGSYENALDGTLAMKDGAPVLKYVHLRVGYESIMLRVDELPRVVQVLAPFMAPRQEVIGIPVLQVEESPRSWREWIFGGRKK